MSVGKHWIYCRWHWKALPHFYSHVLSTQCFYDFTDINFVQEWYPWKRRLPHQNFGTVFISLFQFWKIKQFARKQGNNVFFNNTKTSKICLENGKLALTLMLITCIVENNNNNRLHNLIFVCLADALIPDDKYFLNQDILLACVFSGYQSRFQICLPAELHLHMLNLYSSNIFNQKHDVYLYIIPMRFLSYSYIIPMATHKTFVTD